MQFQLAVRTVVKSEMPALNKPIEVKSLPGPSSGLGTDSGANDNSSTSTAFQ